jgi:hypothetical protein
MLSVKFVDGELVTNVDWLTLPDKVIRYMDYKIGEKTIRLMGYERYLRVKEMVQGVNVGLKGISKIILYGQNGIMCTRVILDLINGTCQKDEVLFTEAYNGKPIEDKYWKAGQILDNPNIFVNN